MEIKIGKYDLLAGIKTVIRGLGKNSTLPILECIKLEAKAEGLVLSCTDLDLAIQTKVACEVIREGATALQARLLNDIVSKLPSGDVTLDVVNDKAIIKTMNSKFEIVTANVLDFPQMPIVEEGLMFELGIDVLAEGIRRAVIATADNEVRPILTGAHLEVDGDTLVFVASDGFRLVYYKVASSKTVQEKVDATIPKATLVELGRLLKDEEEVKVSFGSNLATFVIGDTLISTRLLEGVFINYREIIRENFKTRIKVNTLELLEGLERTTILSKDGRNNLVKIQICDGGIKLTARSDAGEVIESIKILEQEGESLEIAFNSMFLIDGLKSVTAPEINIYFVDNISQAIIREADNEDAYLYLVLPVRVI